MANPRAIGLYRSLLREGRKMPTQNRREWIARKVTSEFRKFQKENDPQKVEFQLLFGETQLETLQVFAKNFKELEDPSRFQVKTAEPDSSWK